MGIKSLLKKIMEYANDDIFTPDFNQTEYENWINFMGKGGTTEAWNKLKKENGWKFKKDPIEIFEKYQKEIRPIFNKYYESAQKIKNEWSVINNSKDYKGNKANQIEKECFNNIELFKKMVEIENKYNEDHMSQAEGYKRLAMLYEKQEKFEEAVSVCKEACSLGLNESNRLLRMIKKTGRAPNVEEVVLLKKFED